MMLRRISVLHRTLLALGLAVALTIASMLQYPGGTTLDRSSVGYSLLHNFLSDLGMTVAYNGQPNSQGALFFVLGLITTIVGVGAVLLEYLRRCSASARGSRVARFAGVFGLIASLAFVGVAFTPENRLMALHVDFTFWGFRLAPLAALMLTLAVKVSGAFPARVMFAFAGLTSLLIAYLAVLEWGPSSTTTGGLVTQVVAQKLVVIALLVTVIYTSEHAALMLDRDAA